MMGLVVKLILGLVLFAGSLVGGLAATGRLNHEGTANIPLLNGLFPAPPPPAEGEPGDAPAADGKTPADDHGAPLDANANPGQPSSATDAAHSDPQQPETELGPRKQKTGRSLTEPEGVADGGHGEAAGGHGEEPKDAHGAAPKDEPQQNDHGAAPAKDTANTAAHPDPARDSPEGDFQHLAAALANSKAQYTPGDLFRFDGLPAGVTPDQINEAWQRVQGLMADIERRKVVLDQQEQQLRELSEDISRRQASLGKEANEIEQMHRKLDAKIAKFQEQVKLVRTDEVAALKRNAQTIASWERSKAAELLETQWKTDKGQDEVLKLLEFMDKDAVNEVLNALPMPMANDILKKRLRVSKEPAAPAKGN